MSESDEFVDNTPPEILLGAQNANNNLLPSKSSEKYMATYDNFIQWKNSKNCNSFSENVFLAYFDELSKKYKPTSLWSFYSMLRSTMRIKNGIDIKSYSNLTALLKRYSDGYSTKKSKILSANDVEKFLTDAPDSQFLVTKVALIFGIAGACRRQELVNLTINDIEHHGNMLLVKIRNTKNKIPRSFTVDGPFYDIVKKYEALRKANANTDRFFQNFQKGKCTKQPIGLNKFGQMPRTIATYLGLPDADLYTGHSFRRTSATLLANSGADILTLKRHGGWRSNTVAESYVEDSIQNKRNIGSKITQGIIIEPPSKKTCFEPIPSTSYNSSNPPASTSTIVSNENISDIQLSPTFTQETQGSNSTVTNTIQLPNKAVTYNFNNCHFSNCFN